MRDKTADADFEALRSSISTDFREQLQTAVEGALRAADDVLFDWAYTQSLKNKTTQDCIDLMRMLRLRRDSFVETFLEHFDRGAPMPTGSSDTDDATLKLELKSDEQQELECAVQNFVSTVTNHSGALHGDLLQRLATLDPTSDAGDAQPADSLSWRLSAEHVAETFRDAAARLDMDPGMQIVLFKLFERCATPALSAGYARIERDLTSAGVIAARNPRHGEAVTPHAPEAAPAFTKDDTTATEAAAHYNAQPYGVSQSAMAQQFVQQLVGQVPAMPGQPLGGVPGGGARGSGFVAAQMHTAQQFAQTHTQRLDQMLGGYAGMAPSREEAHSVLNPMVLPLMRLSASQPELLSDPKHRIRGLLDQAVAEGGSPTRDSTTARILEELQEVIARLAETVDLPRDLQTQQRRIPDEEAVRESLSESRRMRSQHMLERGRRFASEEIERLIDGRTFVGGGNAWMRTVMVPYFSWLWTSKGENSQAMQQARGLLEDLAALLDPKSAIAMGEEADAVIERGATMLRSAGAKLSALNRIMVRLRQLHASAREAAVSLDELMGDQRFQDRDAPAPGTAAATEDEQHARPDSAAAAQPADADIPGGEDSWLAGYLRVGDWWRIAVAEGDRPLFARLESSARLGEDLHFTPIDNDGIERVSWDSLKESVFAGRSRPLHPAPGFSRQLRSQAA